VKHAGKHKGYRKRLKPGYRKLAAALAGAFLLSAGVPGLPAVVQAAANPDKDASPPVTDQAQPAKAPKTVKGQRVQKKARQKGEAKENETLEMVATAYAPGPQDNDQWGTKTHLGTEVRPGIIAVDPGVIPLRSRVKIEYPDGHTEYATAEDTGGAIKGNRIDVARRSVKEAENFGIQHVKVTVLDIPENAVRA